MATRILHVLSNWKWTERSEPAVELALAEQALGADVRFVCGRSPNNSKKAVAPCARAKGLESITTLHVSKHFHLPSMCGDVPKLRKLIRELRPHVVHSHMLNAHLLGALAGIADRLFCRVRSCYDPSGPKADLRSRLLYRHHTDGLIVIGKAAKITATKRYDFGEANILIAEPGVDLMRFASERKVSIGREDFGLADNHFVVGVVSRVRQSRRIDIPLGAINILAEKFSQMRLFIVGGGRKGAVEDVIERPARAMGIADKVILPGYCHDDRLVAAYRAMDVLVYPIPGTDKTCRTVREALASGIPVIAPKIGFLPELLKDGVNGRFMDLSAQSLANVLAGMISDQEKLCQMAQNAARIANTRFSTRHQAQKVLAFYDRLLGNTHP